MQKSKNNITRGNHSIIKTHHRKKPYIKSFTRQILSIFHVQPIEYQPPQKRALFESECLLVWNKHHFLAPKLIMLRNQSIEMTLIDGRNLSSITDHSHLYNIIPKVYDNLIQRHTLSTQLNQKFLIHIDSNLNNILVDDDNNIIHIDFEMGRNHESIDQWKSREISKLLTSLINHVGHEIFTKSIGHLLSHNPTNSIINDLINTNQNKIKKSQPIKQNKYSFIETLSFIKDISSK